MYSEVLLSGFALRDIKLRQVSIKSSDFNTITIQTHARKKFKMLLYLSNRLVRSIPDIVNYGEAVFGISLFLVGTTLPQFML